jgi:hypothetical protein
MVELQSAIDAIEAALHEYRATGDAGSLKHAITESIRLILEEHQDWHLLVRPHRLPLA